MAKVLNLVLFLYLFYWQSLKWNCFSSVHLFSRKSVKDLFSCLRLIYDNDKSFKDNFSFQYSLLLVPLCTYMHCTSTSPLSLGLTTTLEKILDKGWCFACFSLFFWWVLSDTCLFFSKEIFNIVLRLCPTALSLTMSGSLSSKCGARNTNQLKTQWGDKSLVHQYSLKYKKH